MAKIREYECPKCGEFEEVATTDIGENIDLAEEGAELYEYITVRRKCYKCGAKWTEYMRLTYDGCYSEGALYDKNGEKVED